MAQIPVRGSHRASCALSVWHALLVTDILPDQEPIRPQFSAEAIWFAVELICVLLAWDVMSMANQGSQQASSVAVRHAGSTIKVQFGKPFWPTTKLVESLLELAQLDLGAWTGWCRASAYCAAFKTCGWLQFCPGGQQGHCIVLWTGRRSRFGARCCRKSTPRCKKNDILGAQARHQTVWSKPLG